MPAISVIEGLVEQARNDATLGDSEKAEIVELLQRAIIRSAATIDEQKQANRYAKALTTSPTQQAKLEAQIAAIPIVKTATPNLGTTLADIELQVTREEVTLVALRKSRAQIEAEIKAEKSFDGQDALEKVRQETYLDNPADADANQSSHAKHVLASVTRYAQQASINMLEQKLLSRGARLSLWETQLKLLLRQISSAESRLVFLQAAVTERRQREATTVSAQAKQTLASLEDESPMIRNLGIDLVQRAAELEQLITQHDAVIREKKKVERTAHRLEQKYSSLSDQLEIGHLESSPEFGAALRKQRDQLTSVKNSRRNLEAHEKALTQSRLAQFQLDELRYHTSQSGENFTQNNAADDSAIITLENTPAIRKLLEKQALIMDKLSSAYANYIEDLNRITAQSRALITQSNLYANLLDRHLMWMPSTKPIGFDMLASFQPSIDLLALPVSWSDIIGKAIDNAASRPFAALLVCIIVSLLLGYRKRLILALSAMKERVGKINRDKLSLTIRALLFTLMLALPGPLVVFSLAGLLERQSNFAVVFIYGAIVYLILEILLQSLRENGLFHLHFKSYITRVDILKRKLFSLMILFIPMFMLNSFIEVHDDAAVRDSIGRVAFIAATLVIAIFVYRVLSPTRGIFQSGRSDTVHMNSWRFRYGVFTLAILTPLVVIGLSIYGYHYTAFQLEIHLLKSLLVALVGLYVYRLAIRAVAINARRLALERVRAKRSAALAKSEDREAAEAAGEGLPTELELQEIDLQTINAQTKQLLKVMVYIGVGIALWNVWSELLPIFKTAVDFKLWGIVESVDGVTISSSITLWDLLVASVIFSFMLLAAKNVPSLLEVGLLSRMSLEAGTSYAITTMVRYLIVVTGSIVVLQMLGAQWSKLQWLVAALGVGLGFGLQEIVANFVSGIVLLFERPIRIGDTVTVGEQFGTVSRIRMRATTIVDWDRREIVIPNKVFITERMVNWTLTDPITRTVIRVGVAYGSDVDLTEKLLLKIAKANSKVLDDPPPAAVFLTFGDSSLNFELRVFVKGIRDLIPVQHEINVVIDREFRANNIQIAFPQRDLHLDSKPLEIKLLNSSDVDT
ncbi:MAG: mechanosensitive ion channel [Pseudomonadales bacterium]|nr:mechanosensitive ion channel [Pseudomonadales bacterium]